MGSLAYRIGIYSRTKYKAFRVLDEIGDQWVPSRLLILNSGCPFRSIGRLLPRWERFGYIRRRLSRLPVGQGDYEYQLLKRGKSWLKAGQEELPAAKQFDNELKAWWTLLKPHIEELMNGKFNDAVRFLDENYERALGQK